MGERGAILGHRRADRVVNGFYPARDGRIDEDWFTEPDPEESLNDLYTRRLVAWGYITRRGETAWDRPVSAYDLLHTYYVPQITSMLDMTLTLGPKSWTLNPEGKP